MGRDVVSTWQNSLSCGEMAVCEARNNRSCITPVLMGEVAGIRFLRIQEKLDLGRGQIQGRNRAGEQPSCTEAALCVLIRTSQEWSLMQSAGMSPAGRKQRMVESVHFMYSLLSEATVLF